MTWIMDIGCSLEFENSFESKTQPSLKTLKGTFFLETPFISFNFDMLIIQGF